VVDGVVGGQQKVDCESEHVQTSSNIAPVTRSSRYRGAALSAPPAYMIAQLQTSLGGPQSLASADEAYCDCTCALSLCVSPVASLGLVSPGAATDGCHPIFFRKKSDDLFLVIAFESDDLFYLSSPHHSHIPTSFIQCSLYIQPLK